MRTAKPKQPRLVIIITIQFSVRYLLRTGIIEKLAEFSTPIVFIAWDDKNIQHELESIGCEVFLLPDSRFGKKYNKIRSIINIWFRKKVNSPSVNIDRKRNKFFENKRNYKAKFVEFLYSIITSLPFIPSYLTRLENKLAETDSNYTEISQKLDLIQFDAILSLTPFLREEQLILKYAKKHNKVLIASILSFDNITTRGWLPIKFDYYFVWNNYNKNELLRINKKLDKNKIYIVGAPQFDFYWNKKLWPESKWRNELNIPEGKNVILFGGGHYKVVPGEEEILKQIATAIKNHNINGKNVILFRKHPNDPIDRWLPLINESDNIIYDEPWQTNSENLGKTNIALYDIEKLCSTLYWATIHVNTSSTMTIDGAIYDRPQIGPAYVYNYPSKLNGIINDLYQREHFLPITKSGGLQIARNNKELIDLINEAILHPAKNKQYRAMMVKDLITFTDGQSSNRIVEKLKFIMSLHA